MDSTVFGLIAATLSLAAGLSAFVLPISIDKLAKFVNHFSFVNKLYLYVLSIISHLSSNEKHFAFVNFAPPAPPIQKNFFKSLFLYSNTHEAAVKSAGRRFCRPGETSLGTRYNRNIRAVEFLRFRQRSGFPRPVSRANIYREALR